MDETVDVLMATYNGEKYVAEQIESILNQTYPKIRLIISDDGSTDNTKNILEEYAKKDNRIIIASHTERFGVVKNFEFLLSKVESPLYMFSDQDDYWESDKIKCSVECMKKENAILVFGDLEVVDAGLNTIYKSFGDFMLLNRKIKKYINSNRLNYLYNCVTGCTVLGKKENIKDIIPMPTNSKYLIHDHWIGLALSLKGKLAYMNETHIKYRQHGNNQIGTNKVSHGFSSIKDVRKLFIDVKLGVFGTYVEHNQIFPKDMQDLNIKALDYYKMLENKKYINFKGWSIFHKLYKTETFKYYIMNFVIMNLPLLGMPVFKLRYIILKLLKKR